jgi:hypothetical protein
VVLDDNDVFLDDEGNSLDEKVVVLSNQVESGKRKEVFQTDKVK